MRKIKTKTYTDEDIINNAKIVKSLAGLLKSLNLKSTGGNYINMKRKLQLLNVDTSHWTGKSWNKDQQIKDWSQYTRAVNCKKHLIAIRGHQCQSCKNHDWLGMPITLEIEHIDGDRTNNNYDNLLLLCPNCHSQTKTWRRKKVLFPISLLRKPIPPYGQNLYKNTKHCFVN